jgi:hypothetical protein
MDITQIIAEFGAYYEKSAANTKRVLQLLMQPSVTASIMTPIKSDDTIYKLGNASIGSIVQPFQKGWTPKNEMAVIPNKIEQFEMKVDEDIYPDDIEATWLGFLAGQGVDRSKWPLIKWMIEKFYLPKIKEDLELNEIYKGVHADPAAGTPGDPGTSMTGLRKKIDDGLTADTMVHCDVGALDENTIFDQVEAFVDKISEVYQHTAMPVCMSPKWVRAYFRDKRAQGFYDYKSDKDINSNIDFTPQQVVALPSMSGTGDIFATPKPNMIHLTKRSAGKNSFKIETLKRQVFFYTDWWEGVGFGIDGAVFAHHEDHIVP